MDMNPLAQSTLRLYYATERALHSLVGKMHGNAPQHHQFVFGAVFVVVTPRNARNLLILATSKPRNKQQIYIYV
jgi:hypothetical protein